MFDGFLSDGMIAVDKSVAETPVIVPRDTASGQTVTVAGTVCLAEIAALGTFVPTEGFGKAYSAVSLYRMFVRTDMFVGYSQVRAMSELQLKGIIL